MGSEDGGTAPGRPRALLIMGRLQVGLLLTCAVVLLGQFSVRSVLSGWSWPQDGAAGLLTGVVALVLGAAWLGATRPAWTGHTGPLVATAAVTVAGAAAAGLQIAAHSVLAVAFPVAILPVAILVVWARRRVAGGAP